MEDGDSGWCTIESDPGVFTEVIRELGVKGLQVEEIYGLDESFMQALEPIFGFIFLFKWDPAVESKRRKNMKGQQQEQTDEISSIFFASQTIQNACATQAILSILLNIPPTAAGVELGSDLINFKDFCLALTPDLRGEAIGSNEIMRRVHNSFARPELAMIERSKSAQGGGKEEDAFHFVSILPIDGKIYEFDGLQPTPIAHGPCNDNNSSWLAKAIKVIEEKIAMIQSAGDGSGEIRFNLMAVIRNRSALYRERIDAQIRLACELENGLRLNPRPADSASSSDDPRQQQLQMILAENEELEARLEEEQLKSARWMRENARRRHNFIPFVVTILQELVKTGRADKFIS